MKRLGVCVLAGCTALGLSACSAFGPGGGRQGETIVLDTEVGKILIDEVGDISIGVQTETEEDLVVPDEDATEVMTQTEEPSQTAAETEAETETAAKAEDTAETETEVETELIVEQNKGFTSQVVNELISGREAAGERWSFAYEDLESGESFGYQEDNVMQSASVMKLFIMGAVYRYMCYPPEGKEAIPFHEEYDGQLRDTIVGMITVSDNDCANLLVERLGGGDFAAGAALVNTFCEENGYEGTSIGRRFLDPNPTGDNFTTAAATRKFLSDLYHGEVVNEEASAKMLEIVKGQTRKNKIPSGLPSGFTSGNKTGEIGAGQGLGCMENDSAIVFPPEGMGDGYVLTVMSNDLEGRNNEAISVIAQISSIAAQYYTQQHSS